MRQRWNQIYKNVAAKKDEAKEAYTDLYREVMHGATVGTLTFEGFCELLGKTLDKKKEPAVKRPKPHRKADYGRYKRMPSGIGDFYTQWALGELSIKEIAEHLGIVTYTCRVYMLMYENQLLFDELQRSKDGKEAPSGTDTESESEDDFDEE